MNALARAAVVSVLIVSTAACTAPTRFVSVEDATHAERGDQVQLVMADGREIAGKVGASDEKIVNIETATGRARVSIDEVKSLKRYVYKPSPHVNAGAAVALALLGIGMAVGLAYGVGGVIKSFEGFKGFGGI
jgi:hypothetical protein